MSLLSPYSQYRQTQAETASQSKLLLMLHAGAVRFLRQAKASMAEQDYYNQGQNVNKALAIITHLNGSLCPDKGGEIATNLQSIYTYLSSRITLANLKDDPKPLDEAIEHLRTIGDALQEAQSAAAASSKQPQDACLAA
jgi:flagellar protein FliS